MQAVRRWRLMLAAGLAAILTVVVLLPLARFGVDPHHDGLLFKGALDVLDGQTPHRDSYAQYGALLPVFQAAFLWVFGPTLLVLKGSAVAFYALSAALLVVLWRYVVPLGVAFGMWILWLAMQPEITDTATQFSFSGVFLPWSSVYALGSSLAACLLLTVAGARSAQRVSFALASGALAAATLHLRTPTGLAITLGLAVGVLAWIPESRAATRRVAGCFAVGFLAANALVFMWLGVAGALGDWWQQVVAWPREWSEGAGGSLGSFIKGFAIDRLLPVAPQWIFCLGCVAIAGLAMASFRSRVSSGSRTIASVPWLVWAGATGLIWAFAWQWLETWFSLTRLMLAAVVFACVLGAMSLLGLLSWIPAVRSRVGPLPSAVRGPILLLAVFSAASLVQVYPIPDDRHLYWAVTPALGLVAWCFYLASRRQAGLVLLLAITVFFPALVGTVDRAAIRADNFSVDPAHAPTRLSGMRVTPEFNDRYGTLIGELEKRYAERPDVPIMGTTREPLWLALGSNQMNAERYFMRFGAFPPVPPDSAAIARFARKYRPLVLVESWPGWPKALDLQAYRSRIGYVEVGHRSPTSAPIALLAPRGKLLRPPYRCPVDAPGCSPSPSVPGIVFTP
jgi:hypothetical protein